MPVETPRALLRLRYYEAAQEYLRKLPLEHFMESTPQATQRKITLESLDLVAADRKDFHLFNELLVQYPRRGKSRPGQVVPDNMVVLHDGPIAAEGSYDLPLQPVGPFWVLEYVSKGSRRKDYDENMHKYEHELKVPYYLLFAPDQQELTLYRHKGKRFASVPPDDNGRCLIEQLHLEVGLLDGWVRYWLRGELLQLPGDLQKDLHESRKQLVDMTHRADAEKQRADTESQRADTESQRADAEKERADAAEREIAELRARLKNGKK